MDGLKYNIASIQQAYYPRQAELVSDSPDNVSGLRTVLFLRLTAALRHVGTPRMRQPENLGDRSDVVYGK
jgi:hypothetical protein